jgi:hypothetical protein
MCETPGVTGRITAAITLDPRTATSGTTASLVGRLDRD